MPPREPSLNSPSMDNEPLLLLQDINDSAVFYPGKQHGKHLDLLLHLSRYSNLLLTIIGPQGSGKTHLKNRMTQQLDSGVVATQVNAAKVATAGQLLPFIAHSLNLEIPAKADTALYLEEIRNYSAMLNEDGGSCLILVDNAEQLEQDALSLLLDLATTSSDNKRPHIALFGRQELFDKLHRKENQARFESVGHHLPLEAFTEVEARGYLEHRCHSVGMDSLPLDDQQFHRVYKASLGWPGALNQALKDELLMAESKQAPTPPQAIKKTAEKKAAKKQRKALALPRIPLWSILVGALVLAGMILGFLYQDKLGPSSTPDMSLISRSQEIRTEAWQARPSSTATSQPSENLPPITPVETAIETPDSTPPPVIPEPQAAMTEPRQAEPAPQTQLDLPDDRPSQAAQTPASPTPALAQSTPTQPAPATPAPAQSTPAQPAAPATPPRVTAPVAQAPTTAAPYRNQGARREAMLMEKPPQHFTLQMMGSLDEASVRSFIQAQSRPADFSYFEGRYQGRPWYVVVYGDYANRDAALAAIQNLPASLRNQRPWARTFQSVQSDIANR